jgi:hypothetical protein
MNIVPLGFLNIEIEDENLEDVRGAKIDEAMKYKANGYIRPREVQEWMMILLVWCLQLVYKIKINLVQAALMKRSSAKS